MSNSIVHPTDTAELAEILRQPASAENATILPLGGGTWLDFGYSASAALELHTGKLNRVLDYPARDMTITVEAGLSIAALQETLRQERQQVPVDFSQVDKATVGGVVASNSFGPRRFGLGTLRDYLIGLTAVDAAGRIFHAGGRVVKNVAGYDLCKLLVGSWGTLAVVTELTFKVLPISETLRWVWTTWDSATPLDQALADLLTSETRPVAVEVFNKAAAEQILSSLGQTWPMDRFVLAVLVAGSPTDTEWQSRKLADELARKQPKSCEMLAEHFAEHLLDQLTHFPLKTGGFSLRAHLRPSRTMAFVDRATTAGCSVQSHAASGVVICHAPEDIDTSEQAQALIQPLRQLAESQQGSLVIVQCPADWKTALSVFGTRLPSWELMKTLKRTLDPQNRLSPGRLFAPD